MIKGIVKLIPMANMLVTMKSKPDVTPATPRRTRHVVPAGALGGPRQRLPQSAVPGTAMSRRDARSEAVTRCAGLDAQDLLLFGVELFLGNHALLLQLGQLLQFSRIVRRGRRSGGGLLLR